MRISDWSSDVCSSDLQRYYEPRIGRFLSVDPIATDPNSGAMFNRYRYGKNNPYGFVDPDGRRDIYIGGAADKDNTRIVQDHAAAQQRLNPNRDIRSEEHTSELQSLMRISYAVFCLKKKNNNTT